MTIRLLFLILPCMLILSSCDTAPVEDAGADIVAKDEVPSLHEAYKDAFMIGTALNSNHIFGVDTQGLELVERHFNAITPENIMKWEVIHPEPGQYDFEQADLLVEFAEENDMFITGHTLVWHSQTPRWVFEDEEGELLTREALLERMRDHIHTVVGRYKGRVQSWDVVNEALNEDGSLRESLWYRIIGQDYLVKAFEYAREADPDAELYYNDYSLEIPSKRAGAVELIKYLQENDAPVTGIGTQAHFMMDWPELEEVEQTVVDFAALGIDVMVTELDIDVLPAAFDYMGADVGMSAELRDELNPWPDGLPEEMEQELAQRYADVFEIYLRHSDNMSRVTFWGVTDGDSWKNNWPVRGRTNYPLIFDREFQPKPAFYEILNLTKDEG
ncbi:endo-1,4-beta-xylanase [Balneolaceae bacterium ANBcel3]|nr:endo-1,4-beta-xylanase [Balneolaceae bacterium ANBcel3]